MKCVIFRVDFAFYVWHTRHLELSVWLAD